MKLPPHNCCDQHKIHLFYLQLIVIVIARISHLTADVQIFIIYTNVECLLLQFQLKFKQPFQSEYFIPNSQMLSGGWYDQSFLHNKI